jgi:prepilin-type N-terminal cleavage/methylation domain-containing protein
MQSNRNGFTLVELLAAMLFMAIVIPVAVQSMLLINRVGVTAQRKRVAVELAERTLTETIVTEQWLEGNRSGAFEDHPAYRWELTVEPWSEDALQLVTIDVYYSVQQTEYHERLSTLADDTESDDESQS